MTFGKGTRSTLKDERIAWYAHSPVNTYVPVNQWYKVNIKLQIGYMRPLLII